VFPVIINDGPAIAVPYKDAVIVGQSVAYDELRYLATIAPEAVILFPNVAAPVTDKVELKAPVVADTEPPDKFVAVVAVAAFPVVF